VENVALQVWVGEFEWQMDALTEKVTTLLKLLFGTSSGKSKPVSSRVDGDVTGGVNNLGVSGMAIGPLGP